MEDLIIENNILKGCRENKLLRIVIPDGVKAVGDNAFRGLSKLFDVQMPKSLIHIGNGAFEDCSALAHIDLSNVSYIGERAFMNCKSLKETKLSDMLNYLCNNTFTGCVSLEEIHIPDNISYIGCECFKDCTLLSKLDMQGVMEIDSYAFENCRMLHNVCLPKTLSHIGQYAFSFCLNLETVTFMNRFTNIDETAFDNTLNVIFKAVQFSSAFSFAKERNNIIFKPSILHKDAIITDTQAIRRLTENGIMFMSRPSDDPGKSIIVFDTSQRNMILSIIGGNKNAE